jgi:MFS family permease
MSRFLGLQRNALIISITEAIHDSGIHLYSAFWPLYVLSLDGTLLTLGFFALLSGITGIITQPLLGYLSDKMGRKKPVVWGGVILSLGPFINAIATHWTWLIPGMIMDSIDQRGLFTARTVLFADGVPATKRGTAFASFWTIMSFSSFFMPLLGGLLLDHMGTIIGMRIALAYAGSVRVVQCVLNAKYIKEKQIAKKPQVRGNTKISPTVLRSSFGEVFRPITKNKMLQIMLVGSGISAIEMGITMRFMVVYAADVIHVTTTEWGFIQSAVGLVRLIMRIPLGSLTDKYGRRISIVISYALRPVYVFLSIYSRNYIHLLALNLIHALPESLRQSTWQALITDLTPTHERGRVYGGFGMVREAAVSLAPSIAATMWEGYGAKTPFYLSIGAASIAALIICTSLKEPMIVEQT